MKRDYRLYLEDMLEAIGKIERYIDGLSYEQFKKDEKTVDAIILNFTIIGEAAKQIPAKIRSNCPYKEMAGMRRKLVHEYF